MSYIKKDKHKVQPAIPVMSRIAVNGTITQFSVPPHLWKAKGDRAKGKSLEADRINRHLDNIRIRTVVMAISGLNRVSVLFLFLELVQEISGSNPLVPAKNKPLIASGLFRWCQRDSSLSFRLARESLSGQPASGVMVANPESSVSSCSSRDAASGVPAAANSFFRTEIFSAS